MNDPYAGLAQALDKLPNGFPATEEGLEIVLLKKIFDPEEAALAGNLRAAMEPVDRIAERCGQEVRSIRPRLLRMAKRGLAWFQEREGKPFFRLAPFIVGIYEAQVQQMDVELASLFERYMAAGGARGIMTPQPALHRVLPAQNVVKSEWVLPYDDVRLILAGAKTFSVRPCICRKEQALLGHPCGYPLEVCLSFSGRERPPQPEDLSREQALALLDRCEEAGLVHTVSNIQEGLGYVCNCCGCCCGILRFVNELGLASSVAQANYFAVIDPNECQGCGICQERCQVHAIAEAHGVSEVRKERCIGCGLCVSGCTHGAARLLPKSAEQVVHPPRDFGQWERDRLRNRGLS